MHLEANIKLLRIDGIPDRFLGMRIGHLSDIHLTGELPAEYYRHAVDWMLSESPDLICLSGDLIDNPETLNSLRSIFGGLPKDLPKIFVLGNHDRACAMAEPTRCMMEDLGWMDAGKKDFLLQTPRGTLAIFGNERPWFHRDQTLRDSEIPSDCLALAISHSPDQIPWARQLGIPLMLCGHTHGGQIRFPWIGPIIAPSKYGSRFASGVFYQRPTLMHVSRGVSGIHTLRWGCVPEISILELASIAFSEPS